MAEMIQTAEAAEQAASVESAAPERLNEAVEAARQAEAAAFEHLHAVMARPDATADEIRDAEQAAMDARSTTLRAVSAYRAARTMQTAENLG